MSARLVNLYHHLTQERPLLVLLAVALFLIAAGFFARGFELDASSDSLVLENDADLRFYRGVRARYGSDDFLVVTYTPQGDMMSDAVLADIRALRDQLLALDRVESVTSLLDIPLIDSPRTSLSEIQKEIRTLETPDTDRALALRELTTSPLYRDLVMSADGRTTAIRIDFKRDDIYQSLLAKREALRLTQSERELSPEEAQALQEVTGNFNEHRARSRDREQADIAAVRTILESHRDQARIHLGGVPMIASDMIDYVRNDIRVFGLGVAVFLILLLAVFFKQPRWVVVPLAICAAAALGMVGYLGLVGWRVTVVSSNFISLMLIITLSLTVHLIVRYLELQASDPSLKQRILVRKTIKSKFMPSLYTVLTTMVAFASLVVSDIRPVIDFGWMMVVGIGLAFVLCFLIFPAAIIRLEPSARVFRQHDVTAVITRAFAGLIERHPLRTLLVYAALVVVGITGVTRLSVENRFIDYFKEHTEIHQGMLTIDRELGGTTPLDVVIDPGQWFQEFLAEAAGAEPGEAYEQDPLFEQDDSAGISGESYWFNVFQLPEADRVHAHLDALPQTGKVLSISTTMALLTQLNGDEPMDNLTLAVMHKRLPDNIRKTLFDPYMAADGNQLRFSIRVIDSDPDLKRDVLLEEIREDLSGKLGLEREQVHLSGMLVLYNNVLQSLFRSQVLTLSAVFVAITAMFLILFRSWRIALIAVVPTLVAACIILGLMGWVGIPLDIMTITIAAISIGIGVDDTIHYTHRIREEFARDGDYWAALRRSHASVGRAIYYTSVTITLGFSILALSNFIPTIYFGLLTGLAMIIALIANLTLLPLLIAQLKPLGPAVRA